MRPSRFQPIPIQDADVPQIRLQLFGVIVVTLLGVLVARLWYLQIANGDVFREQAEANRRLKIRTPAPRGIIEDAKGRPLVTNSAQFTIFINPSELPKNKPQKEQVIARLADILSLTPERLQEIMKRNRVVASGPIPVAEGVDQHTLARIAEKRTELPGVEPDVEPVRKYPLGTLAAHVLGYIGEINADQLRDPDARNRGYRPGDFIGQSGLERKYDQLLNGQKGIAYYEVDAKGRRQSEKGRDEPKPGATLHLSLDADVQRAAEEGLGTRKGAAVAINPQNGEVIALASAPTFDPNLLARRPLAHAVYKDKILPGLFHRAIQGKAAPGSTFKIVSSAATLATHTADARHDYFFCARGMSIGRRWAGCHQYHGSVNMELALAASCDVYYYKTGLQMGPDAIASWADKFGLGKQTGIDLPGESKGTVPSPAWKRKMAPIFHNPDSTWYQGDTANMVIGQGDVQCTPLQMACVVGAIANGGTIYAPHVVQEARDSITNKVLYAATPHVTSQLGLAPDQVAAIAQGLRHCVAGSRGTAHSINLKGVTVAGKTGSAERHGGGKKESHAWFVCYAPYEKPQIAIAIFLESEGQNYHGGSDAAPIARKMLSKYFHISEETYSGETVKFD